MNFTTESHYPYKYSIRLSGSRKAFSDALDSLSPLPPATSPLGAPEQSNLRPSILRHAILTILRISYPQSSLNQCRNSWWRQEQQEQQEHQKGPSSRASGAGCGVAVEKGCRSIDGRGRGGGRHAAAALVVVVVHHVSVARGQRRPGLGPDEAVEQGKRGQTQNICPR